MLHYHGTELSIEHASVVKRLMSSLAELLCCKCLSTFLFGPTCSFIIKAYALIYQMHLWSRSDFRKRVASGKETYYSKMPHKSFENETHSPVQYY
jgi:hypothetical protein